MVPVGYGALSPKGDNGRRRRLQTGEAARRAFTLTTLCDNAHLVKDTAVFIGYAYLPSGVGCQIGDDIPGQIGAHGQSCVFSRRCVGQGDRKIGRRRSAVPDTE
jgi:hypothetical protein